MGRSEAGIDVRTSFRALLGAVRRVYSFGRSREMVWFRDSFGRSGVGIDVRISSRALLGAVRRVYSFGRSGKMVWFRDSFGRSGEGTDVRTSSRALLGAVRRVYSFGRSGKMVWLEGERKMRESVSPSEGGKGLLGGGTRLYGALEAVLRLLTFGRCAENAGKCLTFGRWERSAGRWNAAVWGSGGGTAFTHLRKVCEKCRKVSHLWKVG